MEEWSLMNEYAIEDVSPEPPPLSGRVEVGIDADDAYERLGKALLLAAHNCVREYGSFQLALSGGSTPFPLYRRLMVDPMFRALPWEHTHLWIVDERRAPETDDTNNFKHINELIVEHTDILDSAVHPIPVGAGLNAASEYERSLRRVLGERGEEEARLDFVMLGMGDNGHTASLFPHTQVLHETEHWVGNCFGPSVTPPDRVTMTYPLLNDARHVAFLVLGSAKASMIHRVAHGDDSFEELPVKAINPSRGELVWYLDSESASG